MLRVCFWIVWYALRRTDAKRRPARCCHVPTQSPTRPRIDAPYLRTLRSAVRLAGGEAALAQAWGVPPEKLARWLSAEALLPIALYMAALDVIRAKEHQWKAAGPR